MASADSAPNPFAFVNPTDPEHEPTDVDDVAHLQPIRNQRSELTRLNRMICSAMKSDVDMLAKKYCSDPDLSLERFSILFKEMDFPTIFIGRMSKADLVEFSENLLHYSASFMFGPCKHRTLPGFIESQIDERKLNLLFPSNERTERERVFGIFLTYCLYFIQPAQFVVPVYATVSQLEELHEYVNRVLLPEECFEPLYCIMRLLHSDAFGVRALEGEFNPILQRSWDLFDLGQGKTPEQKAVEKYENLGILRALADDQLVNQINVMHRRYVTEKKQFQHLLPQKANSLKQSPADMITQLVKDTETTLGQMQEREAKLALTSPTKSDTISTRNRIREKAYAQGGQYRRDRRHRIGGAEDAHNHIQHGEEIQKEGTVYKKPKEFKRKGKEAKPVETEKDDTEEEDIVKQETKTRRRRRSRSRSRSGTWEMGDEGTSMGTIGAQITREIEARREQQTTEEDGPVQNPTTSGEMAAGSSDEDSLDLTIREMEKEEAETVEMFRNLVGQCSK